MLVCFGLLIQIISSISCGPVVETPFGEVEGFDYVTDNGVEANVYLGVPYANTPERFERPQLVNNWAPLRRNASAFGSACVQFHKAFHRPDHDFSEDCLFINFATPKEKGTYPVLLYIHGGGFAFGDAPEYGYKRAVEKFVSQGIVFASIQYRVGHIGFFSTGDSAAPGNMGLWDQALALKFFNKVIPSFGGDPQRVTLMGNSAGSSSISCQMLSPQAQSYFQQAIQLSGSIYTEYAHSQSVVGESFALARAVGCDSNDHAELLECMKGKTVDELFEGVEKIGTTRVHPNIIMFHPRMDGEFFPEELHILHKKAPKKRTICGTADNEGGFFAVFDGIQVLSGTSLYQHQLKSFGEKELEHFIRKSIAPESEFGALAADFQNLLIKFYIERDVPENPDHKFYLQRYVDILSHLMFFIPVMRETELKRMHKWETFLFINHHSTVSDHPEYAPVKGSWHTRELKHMFNYNFGNENPPLNENDLKFGRQLVQSVVNFVKEGNPSTEAFNWAPISDEKPWQHAALGVPFKLEPKAFAEEAIKFWTSTVPEAIGVNLLKKTRLPGAYSKQIHTEL